MSFVFKADDEHNASIYQSTYKLFFVRLVFNKYMHSSYQNIFTNAEKNTDWLVWFNNHWWQSFCTKWVMLVFPFHQYLSFSSNALTSKTVTKLNAKPTFYLNINAERFKWSMTGTIRSHISLEKTNNCVYSCFNDVKEAGNINSSLMVLRQCFETLRENQPQGTSKVLLTFSHTWPHDVSIVDGSISWIEVNIVFQKLLWWWGPHSNDPLCESNCRWIRRNPSRSAVLNMLESIIWVALYF